LPSSSGLSSHANQYTNQHYDENISSARDIYPLLVFSGPIEAVIGKLFEKWLIIALIHKVRKHQLIYLVFIVRQIFEAGSNFSDSNNPEGGVTRAKVLNCFRNHILDMNLSYITLPLEHCKKQQGTPLCRSVRQYKKSDISNLLSDF
jgi:hypothetical protein